MLRIRSRQVLMSLPVICLGLAGLLFPQDVGAKEKEIEVRGRVTDATGAAFVNTEAEV